MSADLHALGVRGARADPTISQQRPTIMASTPGAPLTPEVGMGTRQEVVGT